MDETLLGILPIIIWLGGLVLFFGTFLIMNWKYLFFDDSIKKEEPMVGIREDDERCVFECIGYMKSKMPGENDFGMFVNENSYGSTGGFKWEFLDYCPIDIVDHRRIFVHLMSYDEIKKKVLHEAEMERMGMYEDIEKASLDKNDEQG